MDRQKILDINIKLDRGGPENHAWTVLGTLLACGAVGMAAWRLGAGRASSSVASGPDRPARATARPVAACAASASDRPATTSRVPNGSLGFATTARVGPSRRGRLSSGQASAPVARIGKRGVFDLFAVHPGYPPLPLATHVLH